MLLTLTLESGGESDATDLGFLLHKHPDRVHRASLSVGEASVFFPEATKQRCTAALRVEVDPIDLVKRRNIRSAPRTVGQYVNDRPYVAGSMMSMAVASVFKTAMNGRCDARPDLVEQPLDLTVTIPALIARGTRASSGVALVHRLFEPLGWEVAIHEVPLGDALWEWGAAPSIGLTLQGRMRLSEAMTHLYVLLPVLDDAKHYWVSEDEVDKLLRRGTNWLPAHPERDLITRRYLGRRAMIDDAMARLAELDDTAPEHVEEDAPAPPRTALNVQRRDAVMAVLRRIDAHAVADVGCGEGYYVAALLSDPQFTRVIGVDVSSRELDRAERQLHVERMPDSVRARLTLRQSSATYVDDDLAGLDAILLVEVIEHVEPDRLPSLESSIFGAARPHCVVVTTPNREYNALYGLDAADRRHPDHRFEWTRAEFQAWADAVAGRRRYDVSFEAIGDPDPDRGSPTQLALFTRKDLQS